MSDGPNGRLGAQRGDCQPMWTSLMSGFALRPAPQAARQVMFMCKNGISRCRQGPG